MKKSLFIISFICLCFGTTMKAQDQVVEEPGFQPVEFGLRFMPTVANFDMRTSSGGTFRGKATLGFGAGIILGFNFTNNVGMQAEVEYVSTSQKYKDQGVDRKVNLRYVNIPLLISLNTGKAEMVNLNLCVGPQIGIGAGSSIKSSGIDSVGTIEPVLLVRNGSFGLAYGGGLDFGVNESRTTRVSVGFRGVYGLIDISNRNNTSSTDTYYLLDHTTVKTYSAYIGVSFMF